MAIPQNAATIFAYLVAHGASPTTAAGILGNIEQESGGNPLACEGGNCSGSGYGLIQWTPGSKYFSSFPSSVSEALAQQLPMIVQYVHDNGGWGPLNSQSSPAAAATVFCNQYERPNPAYANLSNRTSTAEDVYYVWQSGSLGKAAPVPTSTSPTAPVGAAAPGSTPAAASSSSQTDACVWHLTHFGCVFKQSDIRPILGAFLLGGGGLIVLVGVVALAKGTSVGHQAGAGVRGALAIPRGVARATGTAAAPEGAAALGAKQKLSGMVSTKARRKNAEVAGGYASAQRKARQKQGADAYEKKSAPKGLKVQLREPKNGSASTPAERKAAAADVKKAVK